MVDDEKRRLKSKFLEAVRTNSLKKAHQCLTRGFNPRELTKQEVSLALLWALQYQNHKMVSLILQCGADPNTAISFPHPSFMSAIVNGKKPSVRYVDMHALAVAWFYGDPKCMEVLLDAGADPRIDFTGTSVPLLLLILEGEDARQIDMLIRACIRYADDSYVGRTLAGYVKANAATRALSKPSHER